MLVICKQYCYSKLILYCDKNGQSWLFPIQNACCPTSWSPAGPCGLGPWAIELRLDQTGMHETDSTLAEQLNEYFNVSSENPFVDLSSLSTLVNLIIVVNSLPVVWLNPNLLDDNVRDYFEENERFADPNSSISATNFIETIRIFPNPCKNFVNIKSMINEIELSSIELLNSEGNILLKESQILINKNFEKSLNITKLPNGIYCLRLATSSGYYYKKIIKQ